MKAEAYLDYGFSVIGMQFNGMLMAKMGLPVFDFFLLSVISLITAVVATNLISRRSDRRGDRFTYIFLSVLLGAIGTFLIAFIQTFEMIIIATVLNGIISGEQSANVIVYELIDQNQRALDPSSEKYKNYNKSREFAKYRVFGSIGFAWTAPLGGYGIQALNGTSGYPYFGYTVMYCISGAGGLGVCIFLWFILNGYRKPASSRETVISIHGSSSASAMEQVKASRSTSSRFYCSIPFIMLTSTSFIASVASAIQNNPFSKYLNALGQGEFFYGILAFIWATMEVPLFYISSALVKKYSWKLLVLVSFIFQEIKFLVYFSVMSPALAILIMAVQVLNPFGISFPAKTYALTNEIAIDQKSLGLTLSDSLNSLGSFIGGIVGMAVAAMLGAVANNLAGDQFFYGLAIFMTTVAILIFIAFWIASTVSSKLTSKSGKES